MQNNENLVTIIIPNYNSENTIKSTILSVKAQTFKNYECIIIDDKSVDNSVYIIKSLIKNDDRFRILQSKVNNGVSRARNLGLSNAKGRFLTFIDSDDIWDKDFLKTNIEIRRSKLIPISHSPYIRFKETNSNIIKGFIIKPPQIINRQNILNKNYLPLLTVFIDRKIIGEIQFKNTRPEDYDLWIDLIKTNNYYSLSTSRILCYYRISNNQRSKNKFQAFCRIYKFYKGKFNNNNIVVFLYSLRWGISNLLDRFTLHKDIHQLNIPKDLHNLLLKENNID